MTIKIGINGCGRIGKLLLRLLAENEEYNVVAINDPAPVEILVNLLKYDSLHGRFDKLGTFSSDFIHIGSNKIALFHETEPHKIPWQRHGVDCVLEASGQFKTKAQLENHLKSGANKVILCQPAVGNIDNTIVMGVNETSLKNSDQIISNASCTTNCMAPVLKVLDDMFYIEKAFFNTVHPYTNNQSLHDSPHCDPRRSRAALCNIIPTTSSAVEPLRLVLPHLKDKIDGFATRVPVPLGAYVEITACLTKHVTINEINTAFYKASQGYMQGIIEYSSDPLVSSDIIGNRHSAIFDSLSTRVISPDFVQLLAWYDNETGYVNRVIDLLNFIK